MIKLTLFAFIAIFSLTACGHNHKDGGHHHDSEQEHNHGGEHDHGHNHANQHMHNRSVEELSEGFDSPERLATQKPYEVIALFGPLAGKTIMDIGSGSGYFSFKLAEKGAKVIAGDVNDEFLDVIRKKKTKLNIADGLIEPRKLGFDDPLLQPKEVDGVIIVNTYHHIEDRIAYFGKVKQGLKDDGVLMIVDFMKIKFKEKIHGPPVEMRIAATQVFQELKESGFENIELNFDLLPHQYIIIAS